MVKKYNIGVDIGGTNVKIALVDQKGAIIYSNSVPTRAEMGYEYTIKNIKETIYTSLEESEITIESIGGIGFGLPGQINSETGVVRLLPNIPGWVNVPLGQIIEDEFKVKCKIDNDVRVATLGEFTYGAGQGCKNLVCITVGTGVGSGLIVNGQLVRGASMSAGEIGHMILQAHEGPICGCGNTGCLEAFASGPSIVQLANEYISGGKSAKFVELANGREITPFIVYEAAMQGDAVAKRIFAVVGEWLGIALTSVVNLLNPEKIIIGGGVSQAGSLLTEPVKKTINERAIKVSADAVEVVIAKLGERAGVIGASLLIDSK